MRKKSDKQSSKSVSNTPADATVTPSTAAADDPPLPSVKEALSALATPDPAPAAKPAKGAGNGAVHAKGSNGPAPPADNPPAAPAIKKSRPEPKSERIDPTKQELDDFSPENLKSAEEMGDEDMGLSGAMSLIKVKRPGAKVFFRCHPDPKTYINVRLIKNDVEGVGDDKMYFVPERMADHPSLVDHWKWFTLFPFITRQGVFGLWPLSNRDPESGAFTDASMSARKALALARTKWVRCWWVGRGNMWKEMEAEKAVNVPPPVWPYTETRTPYEIVRVALSDYTVNENDHQLIKYLDGTN